MLVSHHLPAPPPARATPTFAPPCEGLVLLGPGLPVGDGPLRILRFRDLDGARIAALGHATVVAPLIGPDFDAADLAARLAAHGFAGRLVLHAGAAPDPAMIAAELGAAHPCLRLAVLSGAAG